MTNVSSKMAWKSQIITLNCQSLRILELNKLAVYRQYPFRSILVLYLPHSSGPASGLKHREGFLRGITCLKFSPQHPHLSTQLLFCQVLEVGYVLSYEVHLGEEAVKRCLAIRFCGQKIRGSWGQRYSTADKMAAFHICSQQFLATYMVPEPTRNESWIESHGVEHPMVWTKNQMKKKKRFWGPSHMGIFQHIIFLRSSHLTWAQKES